MVVPLSNPLEHLRDGKLVYKDQRTPMVLWFPVPDSLGPDHVFTSVGVHCCGLLLYSRSPKVLPVFSFLYKPGCEMIVLTGSVHL